MSELDFPGEVAGLRAFALGCARRGEAIEMRVNPWVREGSVMTLAFGCLMLPGVTSTNIVLARDQETLDAAFEVVARALDAPEVLG